MTQRTTPTKDQLRRWKGIPPKLYPLLMEMEAVDWKAVLRGPAGQQLYADLQAQKKARGISMSGGARWFD